MPISPLFYTPRFISFQNIGWIFPKTCMWKIFKFMVFKLVEHVFASQKIEYIHSDWCPLPGKNLPQVLAISSQAEGNHSSPPGSVFSKIYRPAVVACMFRLTHVLATKFFKTKRPQTCLNIENKVHAKNDSWILSLIFFSHFIMQNIYL